MHDHMVTWSSNRTPSCAAGLSMRPVNGIMVFYCCGLSALAYVSLYCGPWQHVHVNHRSHLLQ